MATMCSSCLKIGSRFVVVIVFAICSLPELEARHYVLVRRVYAGEEGRAMFERDESSRLFGWPLGVSSELAILDSTPIFRAVVENDSSDANNNEVLSANGDEVSRLPPLQSGRSAPRRVTYDDSETRKSEGAASEDLKGRTNVTSKSSPTDVQPDTAETHEANSAQGKDAQSSQQGEPATDSGTESSNGDDDDDMAPINIEDIEKIMAKHKIRIMGATHPMARTEFGQDGAKSVSNETQRTTPQYESTHESRTNKQENSSRNKEKGVPEQVMRIAEWLLNQAP
ncbi:uncharacterized protein LOC111260746 isoform X2 [Varroa jacobsoni]|uniref:uncharacterized protein LOC111260746 isoform X2 n=1 Tax=Varroa jacobsoni TaxID=62625 RepID=UPI000BF8313A|nr:uncharacterized protein LOC111260746 isoform X2 [Varroa jacobsoni]